MRTPWGYDVERLDPIIPEIEFHDRTGDAFLENPRVTSALYAASQAIRNYCGWHVCPSAECTAYPEGGGKVLRLPAGYVSRIDSVTEDGAELTEGEYEWRHDGLLRRTCFKRWSNRWDGIKVEYEAGYDVEAVPDLAEAACAIAVGVLSVAPGVTSESADGVSISYSQSAASVAAALTLQQKAALAAYKVVNSNGA